MSVSLTRATRRPTRYISLQVVLGVLMVYFLVPFWWVVVNSSKTSAGLFGGGSALWFADDIDYLGNLQQLFTYGGGIYLQWLFNSALYAIVGGVGATVLAVLAGYAFAKFQFGGRRLGFAVLLGSVMVPSPLRWSARSRSLSAITSIVENGANGNSPTMSSSSSWLSTSRTPPPFGVPANAQTVVILPDARWRATHSCVASRSGATMSIGGALNCLVKTRNCI